jgi:hypothetical protein
MLMMQGSATGWESMSAWSPADFNGHIGFMKRLIADLKASGELVSAEGLDVPAKAKIVRARADGTAAVTDGPFPESKEFLAGYWIVEVESVERAIAIATRASTAPGKNGAALGIPIEVRQVMRAPEIA